MALAYLLLKRHGSHIDTTVLTMGQMCAALVPLGILALMFEGVPRPSEWPPRAIASLLYLSLGGSVAAFWLSYWLLKRMAASAVLAMSLVEPLLAALLGALLLGERLAPLAIAGGTCILVSLWLVMRRAVPAPAPQ